MITTANIVAKVSGSKDLVAQQTYARITKYLNTVAAVFDATLGLGQAAANTSTAFGPSAGGWRDQYIKATGLQWRSSITTAGNEDLGVFVRTSSYSATADIDGYYARMDGGVFRLTRMDDGAMVNLASQAFAVPANTDFQIELSAIGSALSATITCGSVGSPVTLTATDATYPGTDGAGLLGARSFSSSIYAKTLVWAQL